MTVERPRATLSGLKAQPNLNGEMVEYLGQIGADGRFPVKVLSNGKNIRVKKENLLKPSEDVKELPKPWEYAKNIKFLQNRSKDLQARHQCLVHISESINGHPDNVYDLIQEGIVDAFLVVARDGVKAFEEERDEPLQHFAKMVTVALATLATRSSSKCGSFGKSTILKELLKVQYLSGLVDLLGAGPLPVRAAAADALRVVLSQGVDPVKGGQVSFEGKQEVVDAAQKGLLVKLAKDGAEASNLVDGLKAMHAASTTLGALVFLSMTPSAPFTLEPEPMLGAAVAMLKRTSDNAMSKITDSDDARGRQEVQERAIGILHLYSSKDDAHRAKVRKTGCIEVLQQMVETTTGNLQQMAMGTLVMHQGLEEELPSRPNGAIDEGQVNVV